MVALIEIAAWVVPALVVVLYFVYLNRRIEDRSARLIATDLLVFPFCYGFLTMISMGGAFAVGPSVRTSTMVFWLIIVIAWVGLHALRWKRVLRLAAVPVFVGMSVILGFLSYSYFVRDADKVFRSAVEASMRSACRSNLSEVGNAMMIYAAENDDRLPATNWTDALAKYAKPEHFHCPSSGASISYSMNSEALGVSRFEAAPLFAVAFDGFGGENITSAGPVNLRWAHMGSVAMVLTIDGTVKHVMPYTLYNFIWDRETALSPEWESWLKNFERR